MKKIRCAIYTRKSSEEGLEQDFNSLHAQREACAAYIASQKHEGWVGLADNYDDGGLSGGTLERPAVQRLMRDIDAGQVDQIVVYKIDRLTRSLTDFARLVARLDAAEASFVSVTQSFNTATSMGRLTLNMLLSFAQFEREVTAERIRDKIAASKKKGMWMGGTVPLGYDPDGRTLSINAPEAATVRRLYDLYLVQGTVRGVKEQADRLGLRSKRRTMPSGKPRGGGPIDRGHIHYLLTNPVYAGRIRHGSRIYEGLHEAIIEPTVWGAVQELLQQKAPHQRGRRKGASQPSPLIGKLFDETGDRLTPSHANKNRKRHRYYISHRLVKRAGEKDLTGWRLPAHPLEQQIARAVRDHLERVGKTGMVTDATPEDITRAGSAVERVGHVPAKVFGLISRIDISPGAVKIQLDLHEIASLMQSGENRLEPEALHITLPFTYRKRGVETKLVIGAKDPELDKVLISNIAKAHHWLDMIRSGKAFDEIAASEDTSKRRIQQVVEWAFLAPDIIRMILEGHQPLGLTSTWLLHHDLPSDWQEQRQIIATL